MNKNTKIYVAGHRGMVGTAIIRLLQERGFLNIITRTHKELDLTKQDKVKDFLYNEDPDCIIIAAAKVGGIHANNEYPADFIYENLMIQTNIINGAYEADIQKLLFLGSSCIYPKFANQPMTESELLTGELEPTNEPYAIAKIAGIKMCSAYNKQHATDYRSVMPTNLYGPNDNYHGLNSHVIPAMLKRFHEAKSNNDESIDIWGSGNVRREFLHVDDMAEACLLVMNLDKNKYHDVNGSHINIGSGCDVSIKELAYMIKDIVGFEGELLFDTSKPEGTPKKLLDISILNNLGWKPKKELKSGLSDAYEWMINNTI